MEEVLCSTKFERHARLSADSETENHLQYEQETITHAHTNAQER